jgi:hypothetical protein
MFALALGVGILASHGAQHSIESQEMLSFYATHVCLAIVIMTISALKRKKLNTTTTLDKKEIKDGISEWAATTVTATVAASYFLFSKYDFNLKTILILITSISIISLACALHLRNDLCRRVASFKNPENN